MKILFLTCEAFIHGSNEDQADDKLLVKELNDLGHSVEIIPWSVEHNWSAADLVVIRTTWDYMLRADEFLTKLKHISECTTLYNSFETVKWNIHKGYLKDLEKKGVTIVPTVMFKHTEEIKLPLEWKHEKFVIKPAVSASAYKTLIVTRSDIENSNYKKDLIPGDWLCQPFIPEITQGEISLLYFNKKFSHALTKIPKEGDFRVQIEWGGTIQKLTPDKTLLDLGEKIMQAIPEDLLYARVDVVPYEGKYALMELELIEPALYFRIDNDAPKNFSKALMNVKKTN